MAASPSDDLKRLSIGLQALLAGGDTQPKIAEDLGIDQGFISRAKRGRLKLMTPRTRRLLEYVDMRISGQSLPSPVAEAARAFLASGGDPDVLTDTIRLLVAVRTG